MTYVLDMAASSSAVNPALDLQDPNEDYGDLIDYLFRRRYELSVARPDSAYPTNLPFEMFKDKFVYTDLHITFSIEKTCEGFANRARIDVYNMDITQHFQTWKGMEVELKVGYGDELKRLFWGNVSYVRQERHGPDIVTTFEMGDSQRAIYSSYLVRSYPAMTPVVKVFNDLFEAMGVQVNYAPNAVVDKVFNTGFTVSGSCRTSLDQLCQSMGLQWSMQYNEAYVTAVGKPFGTKTVAKIAQNTGMIGSPIQGASGTQLVTVTSLLDPKIQPLELIDIESRSVSGIFMVRRAIYTGDTHGSRWQVECECLREKTFSAMAATTVVD